VSGEAAAQTKPEEIVPQVCEELVARTRAAQGLPPTVEDHRVLTAVALALVDDGRLPEAASP